MDDFALEEKLDNCVRLEREATTEVLRYLREVEGRKLYLKRGFPSLFEYCRRRLGYSEAEADLRIKAMRLIHSIPEVEERIESGELSLTVAAQIQRTARREDLAVSETKVLVERLSGASKRESEKYLAELFPDAPRPERVKPISASQVEIRFTVTTEEAAMIQELMDLRAHANYERRYDKLVMDLVRKELEAAKPAAPPRFPEKSKASYVRARARLHKEGGAAQSKRNRHIPAQVRRQVWKRDHGRCQYVDPATRRPCHSRHGVQFDHIRPFSDGGGHDPDNLRLYCGAHNRWRYEAQ